MSFPDQDLSPYTDDELLEMYRDGIALVTAAGDHSEVRRQLWQDLRSVRDEIGRRYPLKPDSH